MNPQTMLAAFPNLRILVVGDVMLDEYVWGEVRRISPEAPVPVVEVCRRTYVPGGAANAAANIVSLGAQVLLGGVVGHDYQATQLRRVLQEGGIDGAGVVVDDGRPTTTKTRIVAHSQQVVRVDSELRIPLPLELEDALLCWVERQLPQADACVLSDYGKGVVTPRLAERFVALAQTRGKPIVVDPKGTNYRYYRGATVVTPNLQEAEQATNCQILSDSDLLDAGRQLLDVLDNSALLITRGAKGMSLFTRYHEPIHISAVGRNVYDVTGAGDTVVSTLALVLALDVPLDEAATLANQAAGIVVGKVGTATVSLEELRAVVSADNRISVGGSLRPYQEERWG